MGTNKNVIDRHRAPIRILPFSNRSLPGVLVSEFLVLKPILPLYLSPDPLGEAVESRVYRSALNYARVARILRRGAAGCRCSRKRAERPLCKRSKPRACPEVILANAHCSEGTIILIFHRWSSSSLIRPKFMPARLSHLRPAATRT